LRTNCEVVGEGEYKACTEPSREPPMDPNREPSRQPAW
jgi:hypothetical protein